MYIGGLCILWGVDFEIYFGEVVVLMGCNGVGKMIIFKFIIGMFLICLGLIVFDGQWFDKLVFDVCVCVGIGLVF